MGDRMCEVLQESGLATSLLLLTNSLVLITWDGFTSCLVPAVVSATMVYNSGTRVGVAGVPFFYVFGKLTYNT